MVVVVHEKKQAIWRGRAPPGGQHHHSSEWLREGETCMHALMDTVSISQSHSFIHMNEGPWRWMREKGRNITTTYSISYADRHKQERISLEPLLPALAFLGVACTSR